MRKFLPVLLVVVAVAIVAVVTISENSAGTQNPPTVGFVDMEKILASNTDWVNLNKEYEADLRFYQRELDNMVADYQRLVQEGRTTEAERKQQEILSKRDQFEMALASTYNEKTEIIITRITRRISDYAEFMGIDLILTADALVYGKGTYDITDYIVDYLKEFER